MGTQRDPPHPLYISQFNDSPANFVINKRPTGQQPVQEGTTAAGKQRLRILGDVIIGGNGAAQDDSGDHVDLILNRDSEDLAGLPSVDDFKWRIYIGTSDGQWKIALLTKGKADLEAKDIKIDSDVTQPIGKYISRLNEKSTLSFGQGLLYDVFGACLVLEIDPDATRLGNSQVQISINEHHNNARIAEASERQLLVITGDVTIGGIATRSDVLLQISEGHLGQEEHLADLSWQVKMDVENGCWWLHRITGIGLIKTQVGGELQWRPMDETHRLVRNEILSLGNAATLKVVNPEAIVSKSEAKAPDQVPDSALVLQIKNDMGRNIHFEISKRSTDKAKVEENGKLIIMRGVRIGFDAMADVKIVVGKPDNLVKGWDQQIWVITRNGEWNLVSKHLYAWFSQEKFHRSQDQEQGYVLDLHVAEWINLGGFLDLDVVSAPKSINTPSEQPPDYIEDGLKEGWRTRFVGKGVARDLLDSGERTVRKGVEIAEQTIRSEARGLASAFSPQGTDELVEDIDTDRYVDIEVGKGAALGDFETRRRLKGDGKRRAIQTGLKRFRVYNGAVVGGRPEHDVTLSAIDTSQSLTFHLFDSNTNVKRWEVRQTSNVLLETERGWQKIVPGLSMRLQDVFCFGDFDMRKLKDRSQQYDIDSVIKDRVRVIDGR